MHSLVQTRHVITVTSIKMCYYLMCGTWERLLVVTLELGTNTSMVLQKIEGKKTP